MACPSFLLDIVVELVANIEAECQSCQEDTAF